MRFALQRVAYEHLGTDIDSMTVAQVKQATKIWAHMLLWNELVAEAYNDAAR